MLDESSWSSSFGDGSTWRSRLLYLFRVHGASKLTSFLRDVATLLLECGCAPSGVEGGWTWHYRALWVHLGSAGASCCEKGTVAGRRQVAPCVGSMLSDRGCQCVFSTDRGCQGGRRPKNQSRTPVRECHRPKNRAVGGYPVAATSWVNASRVIPLLTIANVNLIYFRKDRI